MITRMGLLVAAQLHLELVTRSSLEGVTKVHMLVGSLLFAASMAGVLIVLFFLQLTYLTNNSESAIFAFSDSGLYRSVGVKRT